MKPREMTAYEEDVLEFKRCLAIVRHKLVQVDEEEQPVNAELASWFDALE